MAPSVRLTLPRGATARPLEYAVPERLLEKNGRSGVPLYLHYEPGNPAELLPQVLTPLRLVSMVH
jgi:thiol:disulfide interchange protein